MGLNLRRKIITLIILVFLTFNFVLGIWVVINYQELAKLAQVITLIKKEALQPVTTTELFEGALDGIVGSLNDPYSNYLNEKEFDDLMIQIQGSFGGLGVLVGMRDNQLTIGAPPFSGTPAAKAGLKLGDVIVRIDGQETDDMDLDTAVKLMRGEPGTQVCLGIKRKGYKEVIEVKLAREIINLPSVQSMVLEEDARIGYIRLISFNEGTSGELHEHLNDLLDQGIKALILDLRNNSGGEFRACLEVADNFVPEGPIVYVVGRDNTEDVYEADGDFLGLPLVVLINDMSASASEIVAGAIKDTGAGVLVGTTTFGKGLVQAVFPLDDSTGVKLTTHKYLTANGNDINQKGIEPDITVEMPFGSERDIQLDKAIEVLKPKIK